MTTDAERLAKIRERRANAGADYALTYDGLTYGGISAVIVPGTEPVVIATFTEDCPWGDRDLLSAAAPDIAFLDDLVARHGRRNADLSRQLEKYQPTRRAPDYAAECAMKCAEPAFLKYLEERHGLERPLTPLKADTRVKSLLAIASKKDLNTDPEAAARWNSLRSDFERWRKAG